MKKTRSQRTLIGRNKTPFYWLIGERTKLQRRTQLQRYRHKKKRAREKENARVVGYLFTGYCWAYQLICIKTSLRSMAVLVGRADAAPAPGSTKPPCYAGYIKTISTYTTGAGAIQRMLFSNKAHFDVFIHRLRLYMPGEQVSSAHVCTVHNRNNRLHPLLLLSSLPFILSRSLSSWSAMWFSKTDQWRFNQWKLIKELNLEHLKRPCSVYLMWLFFLLYWENKTKYLGLDSRGVDSTYERGGDARRLA